MAAGAAQSRLLILLVVCSLLIQLAAVAEGRVFYHYKRYPFKKKQRNERRVRVRRQECEERDECRNSVGLDQIKCIRICMSASCYEELYGHDELEDGEVDVRYNSFKGCVLQGIPTN